MEIVKKSFETNSDIYTSLIGTTILFLVAVLGMVLLFRIGTDIEDKKVFKFGLVILCMLYLIIIFTIYQMSSGFKDEYIQVKGNGTLENYEQVKDSNNVIATISTQSKEKIKVRLTQSDLLNQKQMSKKGDSVKIDSNKKFQLKQSFKETDSNLFELTKGSYIEKVN